MARPGAVDAGLVVTSNFVRAARDAGYTSLSTALAELIDNSLQASATLIEITLTRSDDQASPTITVTDNGVGMNRSELSACLKFGGSSRFNNRLSLGRYGMGLPAASLSQARRVRVQAWQGGSAGAYVELDVDAASHGDIRGLVPRRTHPTDSVITASGCQVIWDDCDRIEYQRLGWLERSLVKDLGRMFRYFLQDGLQLFINGRLVAARDPLFLAEEMDGARATPPFEALTYDIPMSGGGHSKVSVRFTELPVRAWHELDTIAKRRRGIVGGAGVSIIRAGREISYGWHLLGSKRRENYDDWWRCEIAFDPSLDEQFGITNNKQGIRPTQKLREALEPELEPLARMLNARVRQAFESIKIETASQRSCRVAESVDSQLAPIRRVGRGAASKASALMYRLKVQSQGTEPFITSQIKNNTLEVILNSDHAAYAALYEPLRAMDGKDAEGIRVAIELMILSFARTQTALNTERNADWSDLPVTWSDSFARMLRKS